LADFYHFFLGEGIVGMGKGWYFSGCKMHTLAKGGNEAGNIKQTMGKLKKQWPESRLLFVLNFVAIG
jgi:hypothetical protein